MLSAIIAPLSFNGASLNTGVRMQRATAPSMQAEAAADAMEVEVPAPPPLIETMRVGDKTLAGDWNFDPLGLADEPKKLAWYREAEIKHARLAMLAAAGWPLSEKLNAGGLLQDGGRVPSRPRPSTSSSTPASAPTTTFRATRASTRSARTRRSCVTRRSSTAASP